MAVLLYLLSIVWRDVVQVDSLNKGTKDDFLAHAIINISKQAKFRFFSSIRWCRLIRFVIINLFILSLVSISLTGGIYRSNRYKTSTFRRLIVDLSKQD